MGRRYNGETPIVVVVQSACREFDPIADAEFVKIDGVTLPEATTVHVKTRADDTWPDIIRPGDILTITGKLRNKVSRFGRYYIKVSNAVLDDLERPAHTIRRLKEVV
jgi:hypothetical protein